MLGFIKRLFAWWDGATLGTLLTIRRGGGVLVGTDTFGNRYFEESEKKASGADKTRRRWVVYKGYADASRIPADWHGWLHHTFEDAPGEDPLPRRPWEKEHLPNLTGTIYAYRPKGSLASSRERQKSMADYESWTPEG